MALSFSRFILAACIFFSGILHGQNKKLDSLYNAIKTYTKKDTVRVNLLIKTVDRVFPTDTEKASAMLKESGALSDLLNYKKGKANTLLYQGNIMIIKADYKGALNNFQAALQLFESINSNLGMANCYYNFGRCYYYTNIYGKAEENYKKAITISEKTGDTSRLTNSLVACGMLYFRQGEFDKAIDTYKKAILIDEKNGNLSGISFGLVNLGNVYRKRGSFPVALEQYKRALEIKEQLDEPVGIANCLNSIGVLYERMDKDKDALEYYKKAFEIFNRLNYKLEASSVQVNMGIIYSSHNMGDEAMKCYREVLGFARQLNHEDLEATSLCNIGRQRMLNKEFYEGINNFERALAIYKKLNLESEQSYCYLKIATIYYELAKYEKALQYAAESIAISERIGLVEYQRDVLKLRSQIYYEQKKYKLAYENSAAHKKLNDSIFSKENIDAMAEVKYKYEFKDSLNTVKATATDLKKTVKAKDAELEISRRQTIWWIAGSALLLVIFGAVLALLKIRRVKMQNKQLLTEQKLLRSQMNPHFIFNSLQNIRSLIYNKREDEAIHYLNKFSGLTRQILETSNDNYISLEEEVGIIKNYIAIQQLLYSNPFTYSLEVDKELEQDSIFIPPMLTQPFIENAIKHGLASKAKDGLISMRFYQVEGRLYFEVSDNGVGFGRVQKQEGHKSMAMDITRERLANYTKNRDFAVQAGNITDADENVLGARVAFEIPYIYEE